MKIQKVTEDREHQGSVISSPGTGKLSLFSETTWEAFRTFDPRALHPDWVSEF